ncbi:MAG: hypothetical protein CMJ39_10580 [Phycisphaerae bacterium]|nr:hypothetical protein [Phycisphaerae bacterium]
MAHTGLLGSKQAVVPDVLASGTHEERVVTTFNIQRLAGLFGLGAAVLALGTSTVAHEIPMPDPADYQGKKIVEIDVPDSEIVQMLLDEGLRSLSCTPVEGPSPWLLDEEGLTLIEGLGLTHRDIVADLPKFTAQQNQERVAIRQQRGLDFYADFRTLDEFNAKLDEFETSYPDLVTPIVIGTSHEGRQIRGVVIRSGEDNGRPAVLFNGCQHAREWISPMTTIYIADTLLSQYAVNPAIAARLQQVEVIVIPVVNPDGYVFTYASGGDRYWRKNRRDNSGSCEGVDLNRNWGSDWNGGQSTSNDPCSDVYVGPASMSEPEVDALAVYCQNHGNIRAQVDFHAFSELILEPRGYTTTPPPDYDELNSLGIDMSQAIQSVYGQNYTAGNPCNILYCASGTLIDWPYDTYGSLSYCIELRPSSGGIGGFAPPPSEIRPCAEENFEAVLVMIDHVLNTMSIDIPGGAPSVVSNADSTTFSVQISNDGEEPIPGTARLHYRSSGGAFTETALDWLGGANYQATLPAFDCGSNPEFFLSVQGNAGGEARLPVAAPTEVFEAIVISDQEIVFDDNGETDLGWTTSGSAVDGPWDLGVPAGGGDRGDPPADADGSGSCWLTDNVDGNSDVDDGQVILTSPILDTSDGGFTLAYWRWFSNVAGGAPNEDVFTVQASDDNGASWITLEVVGPTGQEAAGGWYRVEFQLDDVTGLDPSSTFRVRFIAEDINSGSVVEAGVDGVLLSKSECVDDEDCPGDVAGDDGVVNVEDVLALLAAFGGTDPDFDIDGNGTVDVNDILIVIASWGEC